MAQVTESYHPGLEGVIAGETAVSAVYQDSLLYRGFAIDALADHATFEEVVHLMLYGELPTRRQLDDFRRRIDDHRALPEPVVDALRAIPKEAEGMDVLRTAVSMCAHFDREPADAPEPLRRQAERILAVIPSIIAARLRLRAGQEPIDPRPGLSHAAQFFHLAFARRPSATEEKVLDLTFILYAEHEFNASAFNVRVCASTLSDMWSSVVSGIGTLKGPLHGGANEAVVRMLQPLRSAEEARRWLDDSFANKRLVMGFGHRVYKTGDHRARILERYVDELGRAHPEGWRVDVWRTIKQVMLERKNLHPNLDYPCGMVYYFLGLPVDIYTPLFVASRVSGWCAHHIEQHENNRLIRPRSRYTGPPPREFVPIDRR